MNGEATAGSKPAPARDKDDERPRQAASATTSRRIHRRDEPAIKLEKLLRVAAQCFNARGFSGTSLKDIARQLGRTDAALYYYVKNKEELVNLCYCRALDLGEAALARAIRESGDALGTLERYIRYQILAVCGEDGPVAVLSEVQALKPPHRDAIMARWRKHTQAVVRLIEKGIAEGCIAECNPAIAAAVLLGAVNWVPKWYRPEVHPAPTEIAEGFVENLSCGLRRPGPEMRSANPESRRPGRGRQGGSR